MLFVSPLSPFKSFSTCLETVTQLSANPLNSCPLTNEIQDILASSKWLIMVFMSTASPPETKLSQPIKREIQIILFPLGPDESRRFLGLNFNILFVFSVK